MKRWYFVYLFALVAGSLLIGFEHMLIPPQTRVSIVSQFAGQKYASTQLSAFAQNPLLIDFHALAGILFASLVPVQLWNGLRQKRPAIHRMSGWSFIVTSWVLAISGVAVSYAYAFAGRAAVIPNIISASAMISFTVAALMSAKRRHFDLHRAWMLRAAAIGLGIALSRIYLPILVQFFHLPSDQAMAQVFWLGSGTNLFLTELWLRRGSRHGAKASGSALARSGA